MLIWEKSIEGANLFRPDTAYTSDYDFIVAKQLSKGGGCLCQYFRGIQLHRSYVGGVKATPDCDW